MEELQRSLINKINRYHEEYSRNKSALNLQIVLPILIKLGWDISNPNQVKPDYETGIGVVDYAFFYEGELISFLKLTTTNPRTDIETIIAICNHLKIKGGVLTNGDRWAFVNKAGRFWEFYTTDEDQSEKFIPHIQYLAPQNIYELGNHLDLIIKIGLAKRLEWSWDEFRKDNNVKELLEKLYQDFLTKAEYDNQDINLKEADVKKHFQTELIYTLKHNIPPSVIKVTFPNGKMIFDKEATQVLIRVVEYIGVEEIDIRCNEKVAVTKNLDGEKIDVHLIESKPLSKTQHQVNGKNGAKYFLYTGTNTATKMEQIRRFKRIDGYENMVVEQLNI